VTNKLFSILLFISVFVLIISGCTLDGTVSEDTEEKFSVEILSGEVVTLIVPHSAGGGYDTYARLIAPYIEKHTGASVVIENISGAAGVVGRNELWNAQPDGYTIGLSAYSSIIMNEINELEAAEYNAADFIYLARITGEPTLIAASASGNIQSVQDLFQMDLVKYGEPSVVDDTYFNTMVFGSDHGIKILPVTGYEGTSELMLAFFRNEFDILNRSVSNLVDFINTGEVIPLVLNGFVRSDILPEVPTMLELAVIETHEEHALLFATMVENSRGFLAPPGLPQDIIDIWQEILRLVLTDPELLETASNSNLPIEYMHGVEVSLLLQEAIAMGEGIKPLISELAEEAE
jgi:tripartite-type tricarboxylate transporter receptor subunit TctC